MAQGDGVGKGGVELGLIEVDAESYHTPVFLGFDEQSSDLSFFPVEVIGPFERHVALGVGGQGRPAAKGTANTQVKREGVGQSGVFNKEGHGQILAGLGEPGFSHLSAASGLVPGEEYVSVASQFIFDPLPGQVVGTTHLFPFSESVADRVFEGIQCQLIAIFERKRNQKTKRPDTNLWLRPPNVVPTLQLIVLPRPNASTATPSYSRPFFRPFC